MSEFELKSLNTALDRLLNSGVLKNAEQKEKLLEVYKNDPRPYHLIHEEINKLRFDEKLLEHLLKKDLVVADTNIGEINTEKKEEKPLSLENITDFEKDGKNYIKIHYPGGIVRVIENRTDPYQSGKERFEQISKASELISTDGKTNATTIFEESLATRCIEVQMHDIREITSEFEFAKLTIEQQRVVYGTLKAIIGTLDISDEQKKWLNDQSVEIILRYLGKKIQLSPEENIVVLCDEIEPEKDEVKTVNHNKEVAPDGSVKNTYTLTSLNEKGYKYEGSEFEAQKEEYSSPSTEENQEYEKEVEGGNDLGTSYKHVPSWKRKRKKDAAFMNLSWVIVLLGIFTVIVVAAILSLFMN